MINFYMIVANGGPFKTGEIIASENKPTNGIICDGTCYKNISYPQLAPLVKRHYCPPDYFVKTDLVNKLKGILGLEQDKVKNPNAVPEDMFCVPDLRGIMHGA